MHGAIEWFACKAGFRWFSGVGFARYEKTDTKAGGKSMLELTRKGY